MEKDPYIMFLHEDKAKQKAERSEPTELMKIFINYNFDQ